MTHRRAGAALLGALVVMGAAGCGASDPEGPAPLEGNPFAARAQYVVPAPRLTAAAMQADADGDPAAGDALRTIATTPSALWLTPEQHDVDDVGPFVAGVMADATPQTVPLFVVYGIPNRDCTGQESAGGLTPATYLPWVHAIAEAIGDQGVVVLEPDALPGVVQCSIGDSRTRLLADAVDALADAHVVTYLDAGHSDWISADQMAPLLREIGIAKVRGFATNVSNYQPQGAELAFASELSALLDDVPYVIDTGRNGDPSGVQAAVSDWCNPPGRALGTPPGFVDDGTALDALLWIKPPAESDGTCHGGPPAGELWIQRAVELGEAAAG